MKKIGRIILASVMALTILTGCVPVENGEVIDKNKTQLYVGVYDGALGFEWLNIYKAAYEAANPKIQIVIDEKKNEYSDGQLLGTIAHSRQDVYFLSANNYSSFTDKNYLADITDAVTEKTYDDEMNLVAEDGTKSIIDAMYPDLKDIYKIGEKYYGLPNWISPSGITYDADLFELNGYSVPTTYNEFRELWDTMVRDKVTPFSFSNFEYIFLSSLSSVWAGYEGRGNYDLNNTYDGFDSGLNKQIAKENAYLLQGQEGKKAALTYVKDMASDDRYTSAKSRFGQLNADAQNEFVGSVVAPGSNRIAMLIESAYWEPEAKNTIESLGSMNPSLGWGKRNFRYMPFPKFIGTDGITDSKNAKTTVFCSNTASMICVNAASKKQDLAKDFVQFVHDRKNMAIYTQNTSCLRPFMYTMTQQELDECTPYSRSIYELQANDNVEFAYDRSVNKITKKYGEEFMWDWKFKSDKPLTRMPFTAFYGNRKLSVDTYVGGMKSVWSESNWKKYVEN